MGLFKGLVSFIKYREAGGAGKASPSAPTSSANSSTGTLRNLDLYPQPFGSLPLTISTVYRCVRLLSESVANLPMQYLRQKDGIYSPYVTSRLQYLLSVQPDSTRSAFDFFEGIVQEMLLEGNAYIVPVYNPVNMDINRLVLCSRGSVSHDTLNDLYTVNDLTNGVTGTYGEDEIIHIKNFTSPIDPKRGISTLTHAAIITGASSSAMSEMDNRFRYGGNVRGIITGAKTGVFGYGEFQDAELKKLAKNVGRQVKENSGLFALPEGVSFLQTSMSSTDMQFLGMLQFTVREVCRFFGVHPSFVFDDTSNNYKSAEMANVAFLSHTLNPILCKIESEFNRKLVPESLSSKRCFRFDREGLYVCDLEGRARYQTQTIAAGIYTVNEWRTKENRAPVEGGDKVLVSANLRELAQPMNNPTNQNQRGNEEEKQD